MPMTSSDEAISLGKDNMQAVKASMNSETSVVIKSMEVNEEIEEEEKKEVN